MSGPPAGMTGSTVNRRERDWVDVERERSRERDLACTFLNRVRTALISDLIGFSKGLDIGKDDRQ